MTDLEILLVDKKYARKIEIEKIGLKKKINIEKRKKNILYLVFFVTKNFFKKNIDSNIKNKINRSLKNVKATKGINTFKYTLVSDLKLSPMI